MNLETILWLAYLFLVLVGGVYYLWSLFFGVPFVPSSKLIIDAILSVLANKKYRVAPGWPVVELGAGDGRVAFALAKKGYQVTAVEIIPFLTLWMRFVKLITRQKQLEIYNINIRKLDFSKYRVAIIYLYPRHMQLLEDRLFAEMPRGSVILSNTFEFKKHAPEEKIGKLLIYRVN
jgi:16S rRNA A1518/A1519 N6-dimethyltransferase RsmA/KsgA/DIM1 with predicted DNA glycosylase/AP lyase activity